MEQQQKWTQLELLERPGFTVELEQPGYPGPTGRGLARLVSTGQEIHSLLQAGIGAHLGSGPLPPCKSQTPAGAAVRRLAKGVDLFLLDQEADLANSNSWLLAARQPGGNTMIAADRLFPGLERREAPACRTPMNQGLFQLLRIINNMADAEQYLAGATGETTALGGFFGENPGKGGPPWEKKAGVQLIYTPPVREGMGNLDRQRWNGRLQPAVQRPALYAEKAV